jgi:hypothetical protein
MKRLLFALIVFLPFSLISGNLTPEVNEKAEKIEHISTLSIRNFTLKVKSVKSKIYPNNFILFIKQKNSITLNKVRFQKFVLSPRYFILYRSIII